MDGAVAGADANTSIGAVRERIMARSDGEPIAVLDAHGRHAQAVQFTRDGASLLSAGQDACVRLWKTPGFRPTGVFEGHTRSVNTIALSPDQSRLATGSSDGTVRMWSFPQGRMLYVLDRQATGAFSPDGKQLATLSTKGQVSLWNVETGAQIAALPTFDQRAFGLVYAPDGQSLLVGGTGVIHRISLRELSEVESLKGHRIAVAAMAISPDGRWLASTGVPEPVGDGALRFWSTETWCEVGCIALRAKGVLQIAFEPMGRYIAVSGDNAIQILSVADGRLVEHIELPVKGVYGVAFSPEGRYLANAAADGKVRVWATRLAKRTERVSG